MRSVISVQSIFLDFLVDDYAYIMILLVFLAIHHKVIK